MTNRRLWVDGLPPPTALDTRPVPRFIIAGCWIMALTAAVAMVVIIVGGPAL